MYGNWKTFETKSYICKSLLIRQLKRLLMNEKDTKEQILTALEMKSIVKQKVLTYI